MNYMLYNLPLTPNMCGIIAVYLSNPEKRVYPYLVDGLMVLQHRGQDAAGIHTCDDLHIYKHKHIGKVEKVFQSDVSDILLGNYGIGHVRYCTAGYIDVESAQPLNIGNQISLVHNGNITNTGELIDILNRYNIKLATSSDSEIILQLFVLRLGRLLTMWDLITNDIILNAVNYVMNLCKGSFSVVMMIPMHGLVAFRDSRGVRPLSVGHSNDTGYVFASETVAIQSIGFDIIRDVSPGECIIIHNSEIISKHIVDSFTHTPCLFEYIYFARPESTIDGILVYQARKNMGDALAQKIMRDYPNIVDQIDVVMPVPDSARISALRASYILQKPYCEGLIKNSYIGRTFIMPSQYERKKNLKMKLNTINQEFCNKTVLIVDDSIVRGNTSMQIVEMIRKEGAKRILFASIAPPVKYPNRYGIAIPTEEELIAHNRTEREVCQMLGADELIYNDLDSVVDACSRINPSISEFEVSCFRA